MFHDLRRTAARNLRRAGVSEGVIMKIGGWKTRSVFDRYDLHDRSDTEDAMIRLTAKEKAQSEQKAELGHDSVTATPTGKSPMVN